MGSDIQRPIDRLLPSHPVSQRLSNEANHSAGYLPADREWRGPPVKPYLEPCPGRASSRQACRTCMLVSIVSAPNQWQTEAQSP